MSRDQWITLAMVTTALVIIVVICLMQTKQYNERKRQPDHEWMWPGDDISVDAVVTNVVHDYRKTQDGPQTRERAAEVVQNIIAVGVDQGLIPAEVLHTNKLNWHTASAVYVAAVTGHPLEDLLA